MLGSSARPTLCPFFGKCNGLLVIGADGGTREFHPYDRNDSLCDLILAVKPHRLVCGFITPAEKIRLTEADIDVRLGSCAASIEDLVSGFCDLPEA